MCCRGSLKIQDAKVAKNLPSAHHRTTLSGYIFAAKAYIDNRKKILNSNTSSTPPHNTVNFSPLTAEIDSLVWGTPANFNGFRVLPSLLQRRRSTEVNQTLHDVWPSPGLLHHGCCPLAEFWQGKIHFVPKSCVLLYWQRYSTALEQWASDKLCGVQQRASLIFDRAAITLGVGPHSSSYWYHRLWHAKSYTLKFILPKCNAGYATAGDEFRSKKLSTSYSI